MSGTGDKAGGPDYLLQFMEPRVVTENTAGAASRRTRAASSRHEQVTRDTNGPSSDVPVFRVSCSVFHAYVDIVRLFAHDGSVLRAGAERRDEMDGESFRRDGHQLIDWIADYLEHPERYPVLAKVEPAQVKARLPPRAAGESPSRSRPSSGTWRRSSRPGSRTGTTPASSPTSGSPAAGPGILGELLSSAFNVNAMLWRTSPAATELEEVVLDWLRQLLGLPAEFIGIINDTASVSSLVRHRHRARGAGPSHPGRGAGRPAGVARGCGCTPRSRRTRRSRRRPSCWGSARRAS